MRSILFVSMIAFAAACGGDDGGSTTPDAPPTIDAAPDAPPAASGLGQLCNGTTACPATAPDCLGAPGAANGFCSIGCLTGGMGTTNAQGELPLNMVTPAPNQAACTGAFSGTIGMPACVLITATTPDDNPLVANKAYTGIGLHCAILCGTGSTCPTGLTCQGGGCFPP